MALDCLFWSMVLGVIMYVLFMIVQNCGVLYSRKNHEQKRGKDNLDLLGV